MNLGKLRQITPFFEKKSFIATGGKEYAPQIKHHLRGLYAGKLRVFSVQARQSRPFYPAINPKKNERGYIIFIKRCEKHPSRTREDCRRATFWRKTTNYPTEPKHPLFLPDFGRYGAFSDTDNGGYLSHYVIQNLTIWAGN